MGEENQTLLYFCVLFIRSYTKIKSCTWAYTVCSVPACCVRTGRSAARWPSRLDPPLNTHANHCSHLQHCVTFLSESDLLLTKLKILPQREKELSREKLILFQACKTESTVKYVWCVLMGTREAQVRFCRNNLFMKFYLCNNFSEQRKTFGT